jgi:cytidyltransferase-like protein
MGRIWRRPDALAEHLASFRADAEHYTGRRPVVVLTSGGFDPLHAGHARCIYSSARLGDCLVVVVNGDGFLHRKKGYAFMTLAERMELVAHLAGVGHVVAWDDGTQFVDGALALLRPDIFAKGGDRSSPADMAPSELQVCDRIRCTVAYGVGGTDKVQSSSLLCSRLPR